MNRMLRLFKKLNFKTNVKTIQKGKFSKELNYSRRSIIFRRIKTISKGKFWNECQNCSEGKFWNEYWNF